MVKVSKKWYNERKEQLLREKPDIIDEFNEIEEIDEFDRLEVLDEINEINEKSNTNDKINKHNKHNEKSNTNDKINKHNKHNEKSNTNDKTKKSNTNDKTKKSNTNDKHEQIQPIRQSKPRYAKNRKMAPDSEDETTDDSNRYELSPDMRLPKKMQNRHRICMESGCEVSASYGFLHHFESRCSKHQLLKMVPKHTYETCIFKDCKRLPTYCYPFSTPALYCKKHQYTHMVLTKPISSGVDRVKLMMDFQNDHKFSVYEKSLKHFEESKFNGAEDIIEPKKKPGRKPGSASKRKNSEVDGAPRENTTKKKKSEDSTAGDHDDELTFQPVSMRNTTPAPTAKPAQISQVVQIAQTPPILQSIGTNMQISHLLNMLPNTHTQLQTPTENHETERNNNAIRGIILILEALIQK